MAAHAGRQVALTDGHEPERVSSRMVTSSLFPLLGARAQIGRLLSGADDALAGPRVAVIGDGLWRRRYGGDSSVIGRVIVLDGNPYTIIGIMERGFAYPSSSEIWIPITSASSAGATADENISVVARLRPDVDISQATQEVGVLGRRIARDQRSRIGSTDIVWNGEVRPLRGNTLGSDEGVVASAMLGATTFLLLIACANVANLLLVRAMARERELAVRVALGAGRGRVVSQLLTEAVLLALAACAVALPLVWQALRLIRNAIPPSDSFPYYVHWSLDLPTFLYAGLASVATGALFGIGPALQATRGSLQESLKEGTQASGTGRTRHRLRDALVVAEVALALVLLVGASLFVRTFLGLDRMALGYDPSRVMTMRFYLPGARYDSASARTQLVDEVLRRVEAVPGVQRATVSDLVPLDDEGGSSGAAIADGGAQQQLPAVSYAAVAGEWFETFGVGVTSGRSIARAPRTSDAPVAVINQTMAATFWPVANPIGRRFRFVKDSASTWYEVIGVAADMRTVKLDEDRITPPTAFVPLRFVPTRDYALMVRAQRSPASLTHDLQRAIHAADPLLPIFNVWSMDEVRYLSFWMYALWATMFAVFGGVALLLASVGVFGVIHYGVAQRTREIGVRVALGAQGSDVLRLVIGRALTLAGIGVVVGLLGAAALTRVVGSLLIGVSATDPASFAGVALLLGAIAALAGYLPARHATRVDPLVALRTE